MQIKQSLGVSNLVTQAHLDMGQTSAVLNMADWLLGQNESVKLAM